MCVAIVQQAGKVLTPSALKRGWDYNDDGGGFAYIENGKVQISKGFMRYEDFEKAYMSIANNQGKKNPMLVHMRIGTSGKNDRDNTHPFRVRGGAMIHNGIMFTPYGEAAGPNQCKSDTCVFAHTLHNILVKEDVKRAKSDLERAIGSGNKMAFLYDDGEYVILNDRAGFWDKGIWYSNDSCGVKVYG